MLIAYHLLHKTLYLLQASGTAVWLDMRLKHEPSLF
jgi:hypothetical protein